MNHDDEKRIAAKLAKIMAILCVRNTQLETLHAGLTPITRTGDYSDVFVLDADRRRIPWTDRQPPLYVSPACGRTQSPSDHRTLDGRCGHVGCAGDRPKDDQQQREASIRRDEPCKCGCSCQGGQAWVTRA